MCAFTFSHPSFICLTSVVEKCPYFRKQLIVLLLELLFFSSFLQCFILLTLVGFAFFSAYCSLCWKLTQIQIRPLHSNPSWLTLDQKWGLIELFFFLLLCTKSSHVWIYLISKEKSPIWLQNQIFFKLICAFLLQVSCTNSPTVTPGSGSNSSLSPIGPISRPKCFTNGSFCSESTTSSVSSPTSNYPKAPGFEREDQVHMVVFSSPY